MPACSICRTEVAPDAKFCPECGASVVDGPESAASEAIRDMAHEYASQVNEHPDDAAARYGLGLARLYEQKWGQAAEQFTRVVELEPEFADAHANLSVCLARLGKPDEALEAVERAIEIDPKKKRFRKLRRQLTGRTH